MILTKTKEELTHLSKTVLYTIQINNKEIEIFKQWYNDYNSCETNWHCPETKDQEFVDKLEDAEKDELDDFISTL